MNAHPYLGLVLRNRPPASVAIHPSATRVQTLCELVAFFQARGLVLSNRRTRRGISYITAHEPSDYEWTPPEAA